MPYWWDKRQSSIEATVYTQRPDLFASQPKGIPIPFSPPSKATTKKRINKKIFFSLSFFSVDKLDMLMTALLWEEENMNPTGWYMTEKYDGMRLYWNGKKFFSRQGTELQVPDFIKKDMPPIALDGELWTQYGLYQDAVTLAKKSNDAKWSKAVYWVFDSPHVSNKSMEVCVFFSTLQINFSRNEFRICNN